MKNKATTRVIFVGMHNKPHKTPLCSSTKSGKLIDRIAKNFTHIKTNLYDVDYYPKGIEEKYQLSCDWLYRINPGENEVVVLLGREVHDNCVYEPLFKNVIKIPHPSSQRSHEQMDAYVLQAIKKINEKMKKIPK